MNKNCCRWGRDEHEMEYKAQFRDEYRGAKGILVTHQIGSFQRKSDLDRMECAESYGKRRENIATRYFLLDPSHDIPAL